MVVAGSTKENSKSTHPGVMAVLKCFANAETIHPGRIEPDLSKSTSLLTPRSRLLKVSQMSRKSTASQTSQLSIPGMVNPNWTELERDQFEERAAILEFDAVLPRGLAEYRARSAIEKRKFSR